MVGYVSSNGSGFIIASKGLVVTNAHVVARCNRYSKIQVRAYMSVLVWL